MPSEPFQDLGHTLADFNVDYRVKSQLKNQELITSGDDWPIFLYRDETFDSSGPWRGLLRGRLLVLVCAYPALVALDGSVNLRALSTSSLPPAQRTTRPAPLETATLNYMVCRVTPASIAYVATQVRMGACKLF